MISSFAILCNFHRFTTIRTSINTEWQSASKIQPREYCMKILDLAKTENLFTGL